MNGLLYPIRSIAGNWSLKLGCCQHDIDGISITLFLSPNSRRSIYQWGPGHWGRGRVACGSVRIDDYRQAGSGHEQQQPDRISLWSSLRLPLSDGR